MKHIIIGGGWGESCDVRCDQRTAVAVCRSHLLHFFRQAVSEIQLRHLCFSLHRCLAIKRGIRTGDAGGRQCGELRFQIIRFVAVAREEAYDKRQAAKGQWYTPGNLSDEGRKDVASLRLHILVISHSCSSIALFPLQGIPAIAFRQW